MVRSICFCFECWCYLPQIRSTLVNNPCALEKNAYYANVLSSVLHISSRPSLLILFFKFSGFFCIYCFLLVWSVTEGGILTTLPNYCEFLLVILFSFETFVMSIQIGNYNSLVNLTFYYYKTSFLINSNVFWIKSTSSDINIII